ncbi:tyrosine-type recombinase/integrase [Alloacidobacterium dinghuense]|uniref:Tyrosine-type recombinase/integrase n=1 Tax=Alloacidobacterium dinghuense TaxID=2763107 RepID=A0A7G8BLL1_9BACT|nr:tyrosine-type recombinase/integrase [Alloacidobacterium dinghuense]
MASPRSLLSKRLCLTCLIRLSWSSKRSQRFGREFRHSFGTLLNANGEDVKTVQELLRHANSRITLDVYTQALSTNKRAAQSKVVKMMVPNLGEMKDEKHSQNGR